MDFIERLEMLCGEKGISKRTLEKDAGLSIGATSKWNKENGKKPNQKSLSKLANYFEVSVDYLMGKSEFRTEKEAMIQGWNDAFDTDSLSEESKNFEKGLLIPVLGTVVAGIPLEAIEEILDYEEIPLKWSKLGEHFGLKIKGNSMSPRILENDVVIVRKQSDAESGELVIALVNGFEATCKKLIKHEDGISLVSFNSNYEPMYFSKADILSKPVEIIGKVVELRGKY